MQSNGREADCSPLSLAPPDDLIVVMIPIQVYGIALATASTEAGGTCGLYAARQFAIPISTAQRQRIKLDSRSTSGIMVFAIDAERQELSFECAQPRGFSDHNHKAFPDVPQGSLIRLPVTVQVCRYQARLVPLYLRMIC